MLVRLIISKAVTTQRNVVIIVSLQSQKVLAWKPPLCLRILQNVIKNTIPVTICFSNTLINRIMEKLMISERINFKPYAYISFLSYSMHCFSIKQFISNPTILSTMSPSFFYIIRQKKHNRTWWHNSHNLRHNSHKK